MGPDHVGPVGNRQGGRRDAPREAVLQPATAQLAEERFSGDADDHGKAQVREMADTPQERQVVFHRLAETNPRIHGECLTCSSVGNRRCGTDFEERADFGYGVLVRGLPLHRLRIAAHVHNHRSDPALRDETDHPRIGETGDVIHNRCAELDGLFGDLRFSCVNRNRDVQFRGGGAENGTHAAPFLFGGNRLGARPRGFPADVDQVRSVLRDFEGATNRIGWLEVPASVRKGVRSDVQDGHHARPIQHEFPGTMTPDERRVRHNSTISRRVFQRTRTARTAELYIQEHLRGAAMRILFLHVDYLEYEVKGKALKGIEEIPDSKRRGRAEDALVCLISAEKRDEPNPKAAAKAAATNIEDVAGQVHTKRIVLYPYAHLSASLAAAGPAQELFAALETQLGASGFEVHASPFGYYKSFKVAVKGHPLSELSREVVAEAAGETKEDVSEAVKAEARLRSDWFVLDTKGGMHPLSIKDDTVTGFDFRGHGQLAKFARYEMVKSREVKDEPPHVRLMQELELVDYEPGSDPGNLRYYPKGRLIKSLVEEHVGDRVRAYGAMEVECPVMYDFEHPALKSYLNRFPARQYVLQTPNKRAFLRFSACFGQFLIMKDMVISYKQLPLPLYELTRYSFRAEQRGELAGLRRLRAFTMPDCHALCADIDQAKAHMMVRFEVAWKLLQDCGFSMPGDFEVGMRVTEAFWRDHRDFITAYAKRWGKPILVEKWSEQFFYFVLKYEWNFVDANDKAAALTTDQIDTENAKRFGIAFTDETGAKRNPLILHLSPSGAIERVLYGLLEKAAADAKAGKPPMLPVWLSPTQVRIVPVSSDQLGYANELIPRLNGIRADLDDTSDTLAKKIRRAEKEWVPYIVVVGRKEIESGRLNVRIRATKEQTEMSVEALKKRLAAETATCPFRPLAEPILLSARPTFRG